MLHFTEADAPIAVVGSECALVPAVKQSFDGNSLSITFGKKGESLVVRADSITADGYNCEKISDGLYRITQTGDELSIKIKL